MHGALSILYNILLFTSGTIKNPQAAVPSLLPKGPVTRYDLFCFMLKEQILTRKEDFKIVSDFEQARNRGFHSTREGHEVLGAQHKRGKLPFQLCLRRGACF